MNTHIKPGSVYNLNQGQQEAADKFFEFLFTDEKEFIISGPAGVGKTYLMNYIIDQTMPRYHEMCALIGMKPLYNDVVMTATTNKAAEVLSASVKRPTSTVHSFFNLTVKDNYSTGISELKQTSQWRVYDRKIIFVDEASMVDTALWKMIQDGTLNCKIVYVGDHNQLAPVHEDLSPVYKHNAPFVELTQPVRNAGQPALMAICQQLRHSVATGEFFPIQIVPGVIDLLDSQEMQNEIARVFANQTHAARILAYTNRQVVAYNDHIRNMRALPDSFQAGEYLVNNSVYHTKKGSISVETELEVLKNHGRSQIQIDEEHKDVVLDVEILDLIDPFGTKIFNVPYPSNRDHYNELVKYYGRAKKWSLMYHLKKNFADLRPRDAATVHKSQGSTYDTVFIDLGNISTCHIPNQAARMLYVAFSRARSRVFLYGDLAAKYGGVIRP